MEIELFVNGAPQGTIKNLKIISGADVQKQMGAVKSNMIKGSSEKPPDHVTFEAAHPLDPFGRFSLKLPNGIILDLNVEQVRGSFVQATIKAKRSGGP